MYKGKEVIFATIHLTSPPIALPPVQEALEQLNIILGVGMEESNMWIESDWGLCAEIE